MIYSVLISVISIYSSLILLSVTAQSNSTPETSELKDEKLGQEFKMILALIVAIVLIITILVIVIIILFALSEKRKKHHNNKLPKKSNKTKGEEKRENMIFVAQGQPDNEKSRKDVPVSGSFVFSGHSSDKPIPIEETYASALQNTSTSNSGILQRPIDLNVKKGDKSRSRSTSKSRSRSRSESIIMKDNKPKTGS